MPYTCIKQPDGLWSVMDNTTDEPATLDGKPLVGLGEIKARAARDVLKKIRAAQEAIPPKR
jgi:hypothetical protein